MTNWFYNNFFSQKMKRLMFCIICGMEPVDLYVVCNHVYRKIENEIVTNNDAYAFCKKHNIKGNYNSSEFHNTITYNEKLWIMEAYFLTNAFMRNSALFTPEIILSIYNYYHAVIYNENPPLKEVASISWKEVISCYWKWARLDKNEKKALSFIRA